MMRLPFGNPTMSWRLTGVAGSLVCLLLLASWSRADIVSDSFLDWSPDGTQGENDWFNGYYNLTQDTDGVYGTDDFIEFLNDGTDGATPVSPDGPNQWDGTNWNLTPSGGPWTFIGPENAHPNGTNSPPNDEHWAIRRWVADSVTEPTDLTLTWSLKAQNLGGGGGTGGRLFQNGSELDWWIVGGTDDIGVTRSIRTTINPGDIVDLALTPENVDGSRSDGSDGSTYGLTIETDIRPEPEPHPEPPPEAIANSSAEFSGVQGQDNWFYGYYDLRDDVDNGDGVYEPDDLTLFLNDGSNVVSDDPDFGGWKDSPNHWDGGKWDLLNNGAPGANHGPWTEVTSGGGHPAANAQGDEEVHWAVRRWESEMSGTARIEGTYSNTSANGDGTVGRILVDGDEVWSELSNGDSIDIDFEAALTSGAKVDFVIDPDGAGNFDPDTLIGVDQIADGNDGTTFTVTITPLTQANALQAGDADMNLQFDQLDLVKVQIAAKYLTGEPATWGEGDWDGAPGGEPGNPPTGNGLFDQQDIVAALAADFYLKGPYAAIKPGGQEDDEQTSIVYNPATGELGVNAPASTELTSVNIDSAAGIFTGDPAENLGGSFDNDADNNIFKATFGGSFGSLTFGTVAQAGLSEDFVLNDLTVVGSLAGGGDLGDVDLIYVPEPSTVLLLGLGVLGALLLRRRR